MKKTCNSLRFLFLLVTVALINTFPVQGQHLVPDPGYAGNKNSNIVFGAECPTDVDAGPDFFFCNQDQVSVQLMGSLIGPAPKVLYWESIPNGNLLNPVVTVNQPTTFRLVAWSLDSSHNLIQNPDFEQGNTSFISGYKYSPGDLVLPQRYDVLPNPNAANPKFPACGDHTTGKGLMLAISPTLMGATVWSQTVPVEPGKKYFFSGWATRFLIKDFLNVYINDQLLTGANPPMNCGWGNFSKTWDSGTNTTAKIDIIKPVSFFQMAGAFAIDDLYFGPLCKSEDSMTIHMLRMHAVAAPVSAPHLCEGYEMTLDGTGSSEGPLVSYQWDTPDGNIVSGANTLHPVVNTPGTYQLTVTLNDPNYQNCTATASTVIVEAINQPSAWVSYTQKINCVQKHSTLTANAAFGSNYAYHWEAGPGGNVESGINSKNILVDAPGLYTVTVTDINTGCTAVAEQELEADTLQPLAMAHANAITCLLTESTLSAIGSSSGPGIFYAWSTPNGQIISGKDSLVARTKEPGTYILRVTDAANFCFSTDTVVVTSDNIPPATTILPPDSVSCIRPMVTLAAVEDSTNLHLSYQWMTTNGHIVGGEHNHTAVINAAGWYTLLLTDTLNGCTALDSVRVEADTNAILAIANAPLPLTCANTSVILNADGSTVNPDLTYLWTTVDGHITSGADSPAPVVDQPGTYQLLLTNLVSGCSATDWAAVELDIAPPQVTMSAPADFTCLLVHQSLLAQPAALNAPFSYAWTASNGGNIIAGANSPQPEIDAPGTYTLTVYNDLNGCSTTISVQAGADKTPPATQIAVSGVLHCNSAAVTLTNTSNIDPAQLEHVWNAPDGSVVNTDTNPAFEAMQPGKYLLVLTNLINGCTATAEATVIRLEPVGVGGLIHTDVSCFGASNGALSVTASGGDGNYSFIWDNGAEGASANNLPAGVYTVVVTDGMGCSASLSSEVFEPAKIIPNASAKPPSVVGGSDGSVSASPTGGVLPFTLHWSTGATQANVTGLIAGEYTVTVIDANGCSAEQTVEVWGGACDIAAGISVSNPGCVGNANGSATAFASGGVGPYTFLWSTGSSAATVNNLPAGPVLVSVTDNNGCQTEASAILSDPPALVIEPEGIVDASCPDTPDGAASVNVFGGTGTISVKWSNGAEGLQALHLPAGEYEISATDMNGCAQVLTLEVQAVDVAPPVVQGGPANLPLGPVGVISLTLQNLGVTVTDNCSLDHVNINPGSFDCLEIGPHTVVITAFDKAGNSDSLAIPVTITDDLAPTIECPADIRRCAKDNTVTYLAPVAADNCLMLGGFFTLLKGLPSGSEFPQGITENTYSFTDASGNSGECSFTVTVLAPLNVLLDTILHDKGGLGTGGVRVSIDGGLPGYTFEWQRDGQPVAQTEDLAGVSAGSYTLLVTDEAGCTTVAGPFVVDDLVGTNEPDWAEQVSIFPNPASGLLYVWLPAHLSSLDTRIFLEDITGKTLIEYAAIRQNPAMLDCSAFPSGIYLLLVRTTGAQAAYRFILK